jgi:S1-C subfamily serine protease
MQTNLKMTQLLAFALAVAPVTGRAVETTPPPAPSGARNENLPGLIREAEKGVFFLRVLDARGKPIATGTGFLVDDQGSLLTSLHVIRPSTVPASSAEAIGVDGKTHAVKGVTASDESLDLAVLKLEQMPEGAVPVPLAADLPPERGSYVLVLGHPQGFRFVSTDGIVSAVNKTSELPQSFRDSDCVHTGPDVVWLQTSAAISPGNSGGPMLDSTGKAIGIIQWMARGPGMNFALHIAPVRALLARPSALVSVADFARPEADLREIVGKFKTDYPRFINGIPSGSGMPGIRPPPPAAPPPHPAEACVPKLLALAEANPGIDLEYRALETLMMIACGRGCPAAVADDVRKAADHLIADFRDQRRILTIIRNRPTPTLPEALGFLRGLAEKSSEAEVRGLAAFALAFALDVNPGDGPAREESLKFARLAAHCAPEIMAGNEPLATIAGKLVDKLTHCAVGCAAPELAGTDRAGKPFKLADVFGQHVVVAFWNKRGDFFDNTSQTLDEITKKYTGAPLAVVGVGLRDSNFSSTINSEPKETPWKFITDGEEDPLRKAWHITAVPTFFLLDPQGLIIGRFSDVPAHTMFLGNGTTSMFSYSSSGSFGSNLSAGNSKIDLTKAIEQIPAIAEPRRKMMSLVTAGPWIAPSGWDSTGSGERTVFFREDGSTNVKWIANWELRPPAGLHLHLLPRSTGCTEMEVDFATGEARVKSPPSLVSRTLKLRDFPFDPAPETAAVRSARECLLAEEWSWYAAGNPGAQPAYMKFRLKPDGTTNNSMLTAWEVTPDGQVRTYLYDGRYWAFDLDIEKKSARSNPAASQIKDSKAFAVGSVAPDTTPEAETGAVPPMIPRPQNAKDAQIDLSKYYNGSFKTGWLPTNAWSRMEDKNLTRLEPGLSTMGGIDFDIRGVVQVSGTRLKDAPDFPQQVAGIAIGAKAGQLHFLHACAWSASPGTMIGHYLVRYADDSTEEIPLLYGANIRDWVGKASTVAEPALTEATEVWKDTNAYVAKDGDHLRLAKFTWKNPKPDTGIRSIDLVSAMTGSAPFLFAITRE